MSENAEKVRIKELAELRSELDAIDNELIGLFLKRLDIAREIGAYKRLHSLPLTDADRENEKLAELEGKLAEEALPAARRLMRFLFEEAKTEQRAGLNIYLIGMPDCGKTRIGKRLAKRLDMPLVDTDRLIMERMGMSIDDIFAKLGEEVFRSMETMALAQTVRKGGCIVATGGGLPLWGDNSRLMKHSGITVFLDRKPEALLGQNTKNRPLLREGGDVNANIKRLYAERRPGYAACADITLDPDAPGATETIAARSVELINES